MEIIKKNENSRFLFRSYMSYFDKGCELICYQIFEYIVH